MIIMGEEAEDIFSKFSPAAIESIKNAVDKAKQFNSPYIDPEHILLSMLETMDAFKLLEGAGVDAKKMQDEIFSKIERGDFHGQPEFSSKSKKLFDEARKKAEIEKSSFVEPYHLLTVMCETRGWAVAEILRDNQVDAKKLAIAHKKLTADKAKGIGETEEEGVMTEEAKQGAKEARSVIATYTINLTDKAKRGELDPVIARDKEIERLEEILSRRTKNNPVLIGEAGVGKTAIVEGLAQKIASNQVPDILKNKKILILDLSLMVAGAKHRGEFEERLEKLITEIKAASGMIILFIDEFHTIVGAGGGEGTLDASNILKPPLARGEVQAIGATTIKEFRQYIEKDAAFERRFQRVMVNEPSEDDAIRMLEGLKPRYEEHHKVKIQTKAVEAAVKLSNRYISDRYLPDKAIDVIDEACAKVVLKNIQPREVTEELVREIISSTSGVPISKLSQDETKILIQLEDLIHKKLIDQEAAVKSVCEAIRRNRAGLKNPKRPVGSFIFMGPTGVGKTQLAKTLAEVMFGAEDKMIRVDMSEYMEKNSTARMIGAPPGYVGYEEGGQLTEAVRKNPYSVILFDEIEKAHRDVFNIFLQILDDGRLTDGKGRTVNFKNTIIICTSNIGTQLIKGANINDPELQKQIMAELLRFFRPEFVNRFDDIIIFRALTPQDMKAIVEVMVRDLTSLLKEQKITFTISPAAKDRLAQIGYDPVYGARPLRRMIQRMVENPLSNSIIKGEIKPGQNILIDLDQNKNFTFKQTAAPAPAPVAPAEKPAPGPAIPPPRAPVNEPPLPEPPPGTPPQTMVMGQ